MTFYSSILLNNRPVIEPGMLARQLREQSLSADLCFNSVYLNAGPYPSRAHLLVTREDLNYLIPHENTITLTSTALGSAHTIHLKGFVDLDPIAIHPAYNSTDNRSVNYTSVYALSLVDRRHLCTERTLQLHINPTRFSRPRTFLPNEAVEDPALPDIIQCSTYAQALLAIHAQAFSDLFQLNVNLDNTDRPYDFRFNGANAWEAFFHLIYLAGGQLFFDATTQTAHIASLGTPSPTPFDAYHPQLMIDHEGHPFSSAIPRTIQIVRPHYNYQYQLPTGDYRTLDHVTPEDKFKRAPTKTYTFDAQALLGTAVPTTQETLTIYSPVADFTGFNTSYDQTYSADSLDRSKSLAVAIARNLFWVTRRFGQTYAGILPFQPSAYTPFNAIRILDDGNGYVSHCYQCEPWTDPSLFSLPEKPSPQPFGFDPPRDPTPETPHTRLTVGLVEWPETSSGEERPGITYGVGQAVPVKLAFSPNSELFPLEITWEKVIPEEQIIAYNGFGTLAEPTDDEGNALPGSPPQPVFLWFDRQVSGVGQWIIVNASGGGTSQAPSYWLYAYGTAMDPFCGSGMVRVQNVTGLSPEPFSQPWPTGEVGSRYYANNNYAGLSGREGTGVFLLFNRNLPSQPIIFQVQHVCEFELTDLFYTPGDCSIYKIKYKRSRTQYIDDQLEPLAGNSNIQVVQDLYWDDSTCSIKAQFARLCFIGEFQDNYFEKTVFSISQLEGDCCPCLPCDCSDIPSSLEAVIKGCENECDNISVTLNELSGEEKEFWGGSVCAIYPEDEHYDDSRVWVAEFEVYYPNDDVTVKYHLIMCCEYGAEMPEFRLSVWDEETSDYYDIKYLSVESYKCSPFAAELYTFANLATRDLDEDHDFNCPDSGTRVCITINGGAPTSGPPIPAVPILPNYTNSQKSSYHSPDGFPYFGILQ